MWIEKIYVVPAHVVAILPLDNGGTRIWLSGGWYLDSTLSKNEVVQIYNEHTL